VGEVGTVLYPCRHGETDIEPTLMMVNPVCEVCVSWISGTKLVYFRFWEQGLKPNKPTCASWRSWRARVARACSGILRSGPSVRSTGKALVRASGRLCQPLKLMTFYNRMGKFLSWKLALLWEFLVWRLVWSRPTVVQLETGGTGTTCQIVGDQLRKAQWIPTVLNRRQA